MAFITLSGTLLDPTSELAVGDQVRFTHKSTTGETIAGAVSVLKIDPSGTYSKDLQYGLVLVEYKDVRKSQFENLGVATVNGDNPATSIPELLNALVPVSSAELIEFQSILADCVAAKNAAEVAAINSEFIINTSRKKQFVVIDKPGNNIKIQSIYNDASNLWVELAECGLNDIFSFNALYMSTDNLNRTYPDGVFSGATLFQQFDTDIIGPMQVRADNNADGDNPGNTAFTGGWHGYNGDQTGARTASPESLVVRVDGKDISTTFSGYCDKLYIKSTSLINGYNTRKSDGTGRNIIRQEVIWLFVGGRCEVNVKIIMLEDCTWVNYYGSQASAGGVFTGGDIHYLYSDSTSRKTVNPATNSGFIADYPLNDRFVINDPTNQHQIVNWIDNDYGLGTRSLTNTATTPSSFTAGTKAYFRILNTPTAKASGSAIEWHGGFCWLSKTNVSTADVHGKILRDGSVWEVMDFLSTGSEIEVIPDDKMFSVGLGNNELYRDATINPVFTNFYQQYQVISTGYGSIWWEFN